MFPILLELLTIANLFLITYLLDIYQFGVWGVANSLVYVFSQLAQLTYVQYIESIFLNIQKKRWIITYLNLSRQYF